MPLITDLQNFILDGHNATWIIFLGIIVLSYILEDVAIITAAAIAAEGAMNPGLALLAIFIGIASGDIALYFLGQLGHKVKFLRYRALTNKYFKMVKKRLMSHVFWNLFIIRFIPGLRAISFTLSGFFGIPFFIFISSVLIATAIWTSLIFFTIYYIGSSTWLQTSEFKWIFIPLMLGLLFILNYFMKAKGQKK